ncbi:MAG: hypothetical protein ACP6IP_01770 [Candidatus Njordarchaeia archaeon]
MDELKRITLLVIFDCWTTNLDWNLNDFFRSISSDPSFRVFLRINWKYVEDEFKLLILIDTLKSRDCRDYLEAMIKKLESKIEPLGVHILTWFFSEIEAIEYNPTRDIEILLKIRSLSKIRKIVGTYINTGKDIGTLCTNINKLDSETSETDLLVLQFYCKKFEKIDAAFKHIPVEKFQFLENYPVFEILYLINLGYRKMEKLLKKILLLLNIDQQEALDTLNLLEERNFIFYKDKSFYATEKGLDLLNSALRLSEVFDDFIKKHVLNQAKEFFKKIDEKIGYIVLRDGSITKFSFGKILYSLANIGINPDTAIFVIDEIAKNLQNQKVVTSEEVVYSIAKSLLNRDQTGELASKYLFYIHSKDFLKIHLGDTIYPLTRNIILVRLEEILKEKMGNFFVPNIFKREIVDTVYESVRRNVLTPSQKVLWEPNEAQYIVETYELDTLINMALKNFFLEHKISSKFDLNRVLHSYKNEVVKLLNETGKNAKHSNIFRNNMLTLIEKMISYLSLLYSIPPCRSVTKNISVLQTYIKEKLRLAPSGEKARTLRQHQEFLRESAKLFVKILRNEFDERLYRECEKYKKFMGKILNNLVMESFIQF